MELIQLKFPFKQILSYHNDTELQRTWIWAENETTAKHTHQARA